MRRPRRGPAAPEREKLTPAVEAWLDCLAAAIVAKFLEEQAAEQTQKS